MKVFIRNVHAVIDEETIAKIEQRVEHKLRKYANRILRVIVQIIDLNGPKGGMDKSCRIEVVLSTTNRKFVENRDTNLLVAIDHAVERVSEAVARTLDRKRDFTRGPLIQKA